MYLPTYQAVAFVQVERKRSWISGPASQRLLPLVQTVKKTIVGWLGWIITPWAGCLRAGNWRLSRLESGIPPERSEFIGHLWRSRLGRSLALPFDGVAIPS